MERDQPFYKTELESASFWNKLTGQKPENNAAIEINNLLAEKPLLEVRPEQIQSILDKYKLNLYKDFDDGSLRELYKTYLWYCFEDNHLEEQEIGRLRHLKRLLGLSDKAVDIANHQVCQRVYERELEAALEDHRLDQREISFLKNLQNKLQLPQELADIIYQHKAQNLILHFIKGAIADERLSPDEEAELQTLKDNLQVDPPLDAATQADLAKFRLFWQIENGEMPAMHVPIELKPEEECYFLADVVWYEARRSHKKPSLAPHSLKVKLAEGRYWKAPEEQDMDLSESKWKRLSEGKAYITSERLIFRSRIKEESIRLEHIMDYDNYANGVYLHRAKGRSLFLQFADNREVFAMILGRTLKDI